MNTVFKEWRKCFSGKFEFTNMKELYAEESFEVLQNVKNKNYLYKSYQYTRSESGELLKVFTEYEITESLILDRVLVQKNVGHWNVKEEYKFNVNNNSLTYLFKSPEQEQSEEHTILKRFSIQTPAAICAAIFSLYKKLDTAARFPVNAWQSSNSMSYTAPIEEKLFFVSYEVKEGQNFTINTLNCQYIKCSLHSKDLQDDDTSEIPIVMHISKKFALPFYIRYTTDIVVKLTQLEVSADIEDYNL